MAIPALNAIGVLPPGEIFDVTIKEIGQAFGHATLQRQELFTRLTRYVDRLARLGTAREIIVDGSFVTSKQLPTDIDILVVYREEYDLASAVSDEERALIDSIEVRRVFGFDLFSLPFGSPMRDALIELFHCGKRPEKGILRLWL